MSTRVRLKQDAAGEWWISYTRYHRLYWRHTGTTSRREVEAMAAEIEATLVAEQRRKMGRASGLATSRAGAGGQRRTDGPRRP